MEIEPNFDTEEIFGNDFLNQNSSIKGIIKDLGSSLPGMDEISSFMEIMKQVKQLKFSVVVFDTAPTGHTLRLLSFPNTMENSFSKLFKFQNLGNIVGQVGSMFSSNLQPDQVQDQLKKTKDLVEQVSKIFKDPTKCTFVCVCIPEFLSVYETERLIQELTKNGIDSHNIVVNQILFKSKDDKCLDCLARSKIQQKNI